jgi:hypothetical protein
MPLVHDPSFRSSLVGRLRTLRPDQPRRWGKMSVDQMLWHVNSGLTMAMGKLDVTGVEFPSLPLPRGVVKFLVLNVPWPKGAPTLPPLRAEHAYDFEAERKRCLELIETVANTPIDGAWAKHPTLGRMSGREISRLHAKHIDHHLKQFGV